MCPSGSNEDRGISEPTHDIHLNGSLKRENNSISPQHGSDSTLITTPQILTSENSEIQIRGYSGFSGRRHHRLPIHRGGITCLHGTRQPDQTDLAAEGDGSDVGEGDAHNALVEEEKKAIDTKQDRLQQLLQEAIPDLVVNGDQDNRLAGNLHISIPNIPNSAVIARVRHQLAISTGSACTSGVETSSHVLRAMRLPEELIEGALRIGLGKFTTDEEVDWAAEILSTAVSRIREIL